MTTVEIIRSSLEALLLSTSYAMSYNQIRFMLFLVGFLCVYFLIRHNSVKKVWILLGNIFFCIFSGWAGLVIVFGTAIIVYVCSLRMERIYEKHDKALKETTLKPKEKVAFLAPYKRKARAYLILALVAIIGIWVYVKIGKFMGMASVVSFSEWAEGLGIIVPLGMSYYTLSVVGYLLDVFWRKTKPVHNFLDILIAMTYFPHIVQGPISKYDKLLAQISNIPKFDYDRVCYGLQLMMWGYIKKMIIADRLIIYTQAIFGDIYCYGGVEVLLAVLLSGVQLYADFSGCMDIVSGISSAMCIELDTNFRQPFFSRDAAEFWTRWHMTLSAWTKAYIFLPIAMNPNFMKLVRNTKKKHGARLSSFINSFVPLISVWLFTGLWHGTGVDYIAWGLYWCAMMTISKETSFIWKKLIEVLHIDTDKNLYVFWQCFRTYLIFAIGKCFTAVDGLSGFVLIFKRMFSSHKLWVLFDNSLYNHGLERKDFYIAIIGLVVMLVVDILHERNVHIRKTIAGIPLPIRWIVYISAILLIMIFGIYGPGFNAKNFAYGAF